MNINPRNRNIAISGAVVVILIAVIALKSFVFISPATKQINNAVSEAESNIKLAQTKVRQNDLPGARALLVSSLASISGIENQNGSSSKTTSAKNDLVKALDNLEQATDASLSVVAAIPQDSGTAKLVLADGADIYVYLNQSGGLPGQGGSLAKISGGKLGASIAIKNISPTGIFGSDSYISLIDSAAQKIASLSLKKSTVGNYAFATNPLVNFDIYQDNLYGLTGTGIVKITDAASGHTTATTWLQNGATLAANPTLIAVDGKVYVLSATGVLTTYFKGQKTDEANTAITADSTSMLLTTTNSPNLYLINKTLGRIYIIKKDSGSFKTLKINSTQAITSATIDKNETIYLLSDNKIWKVQ